MRLQLFLKKHWPLLLFVFIDLILFARNYVPGTFVVGWDNLLPELNLPLNIQRSFWGVWQEYRGLGLLDGMSHTANLVYYLLLTPLVATFPQNLVRYTAIFLTHLLGLFGMWQLAKTEVFKNDKNPTLPTLATTLFYGFNIGVIQMFYVPYETFTFHFAFLPWLTLFLTRYLRRGSKRDLLILFLTSVLATPQAHVPTVWLVYAFSAAVISLYFLVTDRFKTWKRVFAAGLIVLIANSFWLAPYAVAAIKMSPTILSSKFYQMTSQEVALRNEAFGDLPNVLMFKGFLFDFPNHDRSFNNSWTMPIWREHFASPATIAVAALWLAIMLIGAVKIIKRRDQLSIPILLIFLIVFALLGSRIPIISDVTLAIRAHIPFFDQLFRFAFTKFEIMFAFCSSILFGWGIMVLTRDMRKPLLTSAILILAAAWYVYPAFNDQFIYPELKNTIPQPYFELWKFFDHQPATERVAILPRTNFWVWEDYTWNARGSGFMWFGLPQPLMTQAFDPWSSQNEQYFWEIRQAQLQNDPQKLSDILQKYQIKWLIVDESLTPTLPGLKELINKTPQVTKSQQYGFLTVYNVTTQSSPPVPPLRPLQALATNKAQTDLPYKISEDETKFKLTATFHSATASAMLTLPNFTTVETTTPVQLTGQIKNGQPVITVKYLLPEVSLNSHPLISPIPPITLKLLSATEPLIIGLNNQDFYTWTPSTTETTLGTTLLNNKDGNTLDVYSAQSLWNSAPATQLASQAFNCGATNIDSAVSKFAIGQDLILNSQAASTCAGFVLKLPKSLYDRDVLYETNFTYRSQTDETPKYCLASQEVSHCFNLQNRRQYGFSSDTKGFVDFAEANFHSDLTPAFSFILEAGGSNAKTITYGSPKLVAHQKLQSFNLTTIPTSATSRTVNLETNNTLEATIYKTQGQAAIIDPIANNLFTTHPTGCADFPTFKDGYLTQEKTAAGLTFATKKSLSCQNFGYPNAADGTGYLFKVNAVNSNIHALPLKITLTNADNKTTLLETYLSSGTNYLISPAVKTANAGLGVNIYSSSVGAEVSLGTLSSLVGYPIPFNFLTGVQIQSNPSGASLPASPSDFKTTKIGTALYFIEVTAPTTLTNHQAFQDSWLGFTQNGQLLKHTAVNGWENGWELPKDFTGQVYLVFWPQFLEQAGFIIALITLIILIIPTLKHRTGAAT